MAAPTISFGGIASGLDTGAIIDALLGVKAKPISLLSKQKTDFNLLKSKYKALESKVQTLQDAADDLKKSSDLLAFTAASSDTTVATASANGNAAEGSFNLTVNSLAKSQSDGSNTLADFDTTSAGTGTISITIDGTQHDIAIASGASTLEDVQHAINDADIGVSATIVNTGTASNQYELVLTSDETGTDNSFSVDTSGLTGGALTGFSSLQVASNASITVNGLTVERSSNEFDDVVAGVSFTAFNTGASTITVNSDKSAIKEKIEKFVAAQSDLVSFINGEISVPDGAEVGGSFNGESAVVSIKSQILNTISQGGFPGGSLSTLAQVGIELSSDGTMTFDQAKFDSAAEDSLDDVVAMLTTKGDFVTGDNFSLYDVPDNIVSGDYALSVTQAATQANATASGAFASGGLGQAETLSFTQGTKSVDVALDPADTIEQAIVKINKALDDADITVKVEDDGGSLKFEGDTFGSKHGFSVVSDQSGATSSGVGTSVVTATALDVVGTINGEAATGDGQFLTADDGTSVEGMRVRFTGTSAGSGSVTVGPDGFFVKMENLLDNFLDPVSGLIKGRVDTLNKNVDKIDDRIDTLEERLEEHEEFLRLRFAALEQVLGKLQSQQSFVSTLTNF